MANTPADSEDDSYTEGFLGTSLAELATLSDLDLAQWHARQSAGTAQLILAEREWQRRFAAVQQSAQRKLAFTLAAISLAASLVTTVITLTLQTYVVGKQHKQQAAECCADQAAACNRH